MSKKKKPSFRISIICFFSFILFSCGSNISQNKMEDHEKQIKEWIEYCEMYKKQIKSLNQMNDEIEKSGLKHIKEIKDIILKNKELKNQLIEEDKTYRSIDVFMRSYSNIDMLYNKLNTIVFTIIGDEKKLKMYKFEKDWFLPKTKDTGYMGYSNICDINIYN